MKKSIKLRYRNSFVDFMQDGMSTQERIKGFDKRRLRKWSLKRIRKLIETE